MTSQVGPSLKDVFKLEYPQSVGVFNTYEDAQKVVDYLADKEFAVQNLCIVGTDLKSVERVLGRRTWGTVIWSGVQSGLTTGLMIGIIAWLFMPGVNTLSIFIAALLIGMVIGVIMQAISYGMSRGRRDFRSVSQTVATHYEVLCEHKVAQKARDVIAAMPGVRAAAFMPQAASAATYPSAPVVYPPAAQAPYPYPGYPQASGYPQGPYPMPSYPYAFPPAGYAQQSAPGAPASAQPGPTAVAPDAAGSHVTGSPSGAAPSSSGLPTVGSAEPTGEMVAGTPSAPARQIDSVPTAVVSPASSGTSLGDISANADAPSPFAPPPQAVASDGDNSVR